MAGSLATLRRICRDKTSPYVTLVVSNPLEESSFLESINLSATEYLVQVSWTALLELPYCFHNSQPEEIEEFQKGFS